MVGAGATIEPFGSFVSNLFSRWGDLDVSIQLHNGSCISTCGKKLKQSILKDVQKALRKKGTLLLLNTSFLPLVCLTPELVRHHQESLD